MIPITPEVPRSTAMYERPPFVQRYDSARVPSITLEFCAVTLPSDTRSATDARNERLANRAVDELRRYGRFRAGWDGYRGQPFPDDLIKRAVDVVRVFTFFNRLQNASIDAIIPGPASDKSIDIEFKRAGKTLIVTMYPDAAEAEVYRESDGVETYIMVSARPMDLVRQFAWLAG